MTNHLSTSDPSRGSTLPTLNEDRPSHQTPHNQWDNYQLPTTEDGGNSSSDRITSFASRNKHTLLYTALGAGLATSILLNGLQASNVISSCGSVSNPDELGKDLDQCKSDNETSTEKWQKALEDLQEAQGMISDLQGIIENLNETSSTSSAEIQPSTTINTAMDISVTPTATSTSEQNAESATSISDVVPT
ncbi:uncharacterized protein L201_001385 [Kwoniella dendrophila CBS 6074]|uniref:SMODS and SLOG-associating 2TM effector domain-containing protein n=1 Tax=Kwoniella dendrophila CBS 6074 TaxID=1295534 RepID=A0AAX4JNQ4_9TREE